MPAGWRVISDTDFAAADIAPVAQKLGTEISALRNTVYHVDTKQVKVNTLVVPDAESATALMTKLGSIKPAQFLLRKDLLIYEFVCKDDAIPLVAEGRKHLESQ